MSHFVLMVVYSLIVSVFFATLAQRPTPRARVVLFLQLFFGMVLGGLLVAWLMYPFPAGPPGGVPAAAPVP